MRGSQDECIEALKKGRLIAISPGGLREALFSNKNYTLLWGKRKGFAQVAIDAEVVSEHNWTIPLWADLLCCLVVYNGLFYPIF